MCSSVVCCCLSLHFGSVVFFLGLVPHIRYGCAYVLAHIQRRDFHRLRWLRGCRCWCPQPAYETHAHAHHIHTHNLIIAVVLNVLWRLHYPSVHCRYAIFGRFESQPNWQREINFFLFSRQQIHDDEEKISFLFVCSVSRWWMNSWTIEGNSSGCRSAKLFSLVLDGRSEWHRRRIADYWRYYFVLWVIPVVDTYEETRWMLMANATRVLCMSSTIDWCRPVTHMATFAERIFFFSFFVPSAIFRSNDKIPAYSAERLNNIPTAYMSDFSAFG